MRFFALIALTFGVLAHTFAQSEIAHDGAEPDTTRCYCIKQEIVIEGMRNDKGSGAGISRSPGSTDDALRFAEGVDMVRRANFASEPTIRGMSGGQLSVTIDGMKVVCACVDKMDPVTSYVEVENLSRLEVVKGGGELSHAQTIGGSIDLVTAKPELDGPTLYHFESGYESASQLRFIRGSGSGSIGPLGFRGSASVKRADAFRAGGDVRIPHSGYAKENYKFDVSLGIGNSHTMRVSYIGDNARDIGYPALIMDTRKTEMHMLSLEHEWKEVTSSIPLLTTRVYMNRIQHWMDDLDRSRQEIATRVIMPSMNMPMFGQTQVIGFLHEARYADANQAVRLNAEAYNLRAFADMNMFSLSPGVAAMHVYNVGDATLTSVGLAAEYIRQMSSMTFLGFAGRCDYSGRDLLEKTARDALAIFWQGTGSRIRYFAGSVSASAEIKPSTDFSVRWTGSRSQRLPTHVENYGYFLYNPMDNSIYLGNPRLVPERSWQSDVVLRWSSGATATSASLYYVGIDNYIAGLTILSGNPSNLLFPQAFRRFDNIGRARIFGGELTGSIRPVEHLEVRAMIRAQEGHSISLDEPLPLMPPLIGLFTLRAFSDSMWIEATARFANSQVRVSRSILPEDQTGGFAVIEIRAGILINQTFEFRGGVENLLNRLYHEHTSINNLPSLGRNVYLTMGFRL